MNIHLPQQLEVYIAELVETSGYQKPDEVVAEALQEHQNRRQGKELEMSSTLDQLLNEGLQNLEKTVTTDDLRSR